VDPHVFAVCWKPVELRRLVDPLTGEVEGEPRSLGVSPADEAALEWALRYRDVAGGSVRVVAAAGREADEVLRAALAAGADEVVRVDGPPDAPSDDVARSIAPHVVGAFAIWCGDVSSDRGSGAVPAYLAAELGIAQALGLVRVELIERGDMPAGAPAARMTRRLDAGRRERLLVDVPAVLSCEGGTAKLRRASLSALLAARKAPVTVVAPPPPPSGPRASSVVPPPEVLAVSPFRPPPHVVPPPPGALARDRIRSLTGLAVQPRTARTVTLDPEDAAEVILDALEAWGELP
jgi:electron transfer flavoprotein beta subunit